MHNVSQQSENGVTILAGVLRGLQAERISKYHLDEAPEYDSMPYLSREEVTAAIYWLIDKKYIIQTKGKYPVLHITNMGLTYKEHLTPGNMKSLVGVLSDADTD